MAREVRVLFEPTGRNAYVLPGTPLVEAAAEAGVILEGPCGGRGTCGKCVLRVMSGDCPATPAEERVLGRDRTAGGYRLACQCRVHKAVTVEVPESSLFQGVQQILLGAADAGGDAARPPATAAPGAGTYGVAFDVGTTTIVGSLVDLATGHEKAVYGMVNPQTSFGDDVVSRIKKCREEKDGLRVLHEAVTGAVGTIVGNLLRESRVPADRVRRAAFAGNSAMQQILCNLDPSALGEIPFTPAFREPPTFRAADLRLPLPADCDVYVFPQIGGFVGGDTVAGIVATRLDRIAGPVLFVDVGTNGEIVLARDGRLTATSVAAGPAFEGARIVNGMRAAAGAIEKVVCDRDLQVNVIGNRKPSGICGSGLIDAMAVLLQTGVVDETGRVRDPEELPGTVPAAVRRRVERAEGGNRFLLVGADHSATGKALYLYQKDVRELQLANGAIRAGIRVLLRREGLAAADLEGVLLAGAFGNFIRRNHAMRIGMLPALAHERVRFVGNTSAAGARHAVCSDAERVYALEIMRKTRHVDLSREPDFQEEFGAAMVFPGDYSGQQESNRGLRG